MLKTILANARRQLYAPDGPLTAETQLAPSRQLGIGMVPASRAPSATVDSVCGFCSTGCALRVHLREGRAVNLSPAPGYPVNDGMACPKGWEALTPLAAPDRATAPLMRRSNGTFARVDWNTALDLFSRRFKDIQRQHGPDSVAFLSTGQMVTEEMALLGALAKFGMGMIHGDGNTRQCMATAVTAYKESFGFDAPPYTYADFEETDVAVLVGSNLAIAHPIMWQRLVMSKLGPEIVVIDPRKTETAMAATRHYALSPKSDLWLFYGLAHILVRDHRIDRDFIDRHTSGFEEFAAHVRQYDPASVAAATGLAVEDLESLAALLVRHPRVSFWWTMGVNQSYEGVRVAQAIINLALMTGNIGRPGTGANSITGQCNAMGSRLFSNTTSLLGGHAFENPEHRRKVASVLEIPESAIPDRGSWAYDQIIEGISANKIRGLWIIATNSAHSWVNQNNLKGILEKLDFLVVQDMYASTETARLADLVLPAAGWGEKEGTFINSERRIGRVKQVASPPGKARPDFEIFHAIARRWGCSDLFGTWQTPRDVFERLKELSREQPCDITGITDYPMLDALGGIQWPFPQGSVQPAPERRLFEDGKFFHPDGRARFCFESPRSIPEPTTKDYPFILLTGRGSSAQWHTQTRTGKSAVLRKLYPADPYVEVHPDDARDHGLAPRQWIFLLSRRGRIRVRVQITPTVRPGHLFLPMHYDVSNQLTNAAFDPYSRQPSYKDTAVCIRIPRYWEDGA